MMNYKVILFFLSLLFVGTLIIFKYIDIPAPQQIQIKILDVNEDAVR